MARVAHLVAACLLVLHVQGVRILPEVNTKYMVVVPAWLPFPSLQEACLHLQSVWPSLTVKVTLETVSRNHTLLARTVRTDHSECFSFAVPPPSEGIEEVATVRVRGLGSASFEGSKQVLIQIGGNGTFCQTDKPIYQPKQTVNFRIVTMNNDFTVQRGPYSKVELQDPNGNVIGQWLNLSADSGIVDLSYQLPAEPTIGIYTIDVDRKTSVTFPVEEYVLPKFEVDIVEPSQVYALALSVPLKVCGSYTYGKPVLGAVKGSLCQRAYNNVWWQPEGAPPPIQDICQNITGQMDKTGCFTVKPPMSAFNLTNYQYSRSLDAEFTMTEDGTGVEAKTSSVIEISFVAGTVTFEDALPFYQTGMPYTAKMKVLDQDGAILKIHTVYLSIFQGGVETKKSYVTDNQGMASFTLDTSTWNDSINLQGKLSLALPLFDPNTVNTNYQDAYLYLDPFYANVRSAIIIPPISGIMLCGQKQDITVEYVLNRADLGIARQLTFHYIVMGRRGATVSGKRMVIYGPKLKGSTTFSLTFTPDYAPAARILVYAFFPNGGVTAANSVVQVSMCFKNKATLGFSEKEVLPGSPVRLQIRTAPLSLCAVRALDKSLLLLKPEAELSNQTVYDLFSNLNVGGYPYQVEEYNTCFDNFIPLPGPILVRKKRMIRWPIYSSALDVFSRFKEAGLKCVTNFLVQKKQVCRPWPILMGVNNVAIREPEANIEAIPEIAAAPPAAVPVAGVGKSSSNQLRQYFPETWIWSLTHVGRTGENHWEVKAPDTITEWKASMFCLDSHGAFGLAPDVTLKTFKPFFVDLALPVSVVRGEGFLLKASVFNYLTQCMKVQVTLSKSSEFQVQPCMNCVYSNCLCAGEAKTFTWNVTATKLGDVNFTVSTEARKTAELCGGQKTIVPTKGASDTLIKPLRVKPEGVPQEQTHSSFLCPQGNTVQDAVNLQLPANLVPDSARAVCAVQGDIMGSALQNMDKLIQMPYGCGEQNMLIFAPMLFAMTYLVNTGQLTPEIRAKAVGYMTSGYIGEMKYKHNDGSYSAFGESDREGSTWLTIFVVKCFTLASPYIFIDQSVLDQGLAWLRARQLPSGCFQNVGQIFHTTMKGGVDDEVSLAAYIVASMLQMGIPFNDTMVANGLLCLKNAAPTVNSTYTQALLAYTMTLAKDGPLRAQLLAKLELKANITGDLKFWSYKPSAASDAPFWSQPQAADVETTAYVVLALLSESSTTNEDIAAVLPVVRWLSKQQNAYGGFASTQDTVVGLQALARFAEVTFKGDANVKVSVKSAKSLARSFLINQSNRLLVQSAPLTEVPGMYTVSANGTGCIFAQLTLRYNIFPNQKEAAFALSVETDWKCGPTQKINRLLNMTITARYTGSRPVTNMVILECNLLSGFVLADGAADLLMTEPLVKKVETVDSLVNIYVEQMDKNPQTFTVIAEQDFKVKDLKPAAVKIYDYYSPEENMVTEYNICE